MSALLLEPIGGISGDMFLGAVADLGLDLQELVGLLHGVGLRGFQILSRRAAGGATMGVQVEVQVDGGGSEGGHGRSWSEIRSLLDHPGLQGAIGARSVAVFRRLARVEARIHGVPEEEIHFHEVGAVDSIVDIVGAAWALNRLHVTEVFSRPPPLGSGLVQSAHGPLPIPAPATVALLSGLPARWEGEGEMTTPTGAALLAEFASFKVPEIFTVEQTGYGVGHATWADRPNLLRASLGRAASMESSDQVGLLETHLDDATPELLGHLIERLMEGGALDACLGPVLMKKGRPGQRLTVVSRSADRSKLTELIFRESTSLGIRWSAVERDELERRTQAVETAFGPIHVKLGLRHGQVWNVAPEYEDCVAIARARAVPLKEVMAAAVAAFQLVASRK